MEEDEIALRLAALAKIMLWHVVATDTVLKGHMETVANLIGDDLHHLPPTSRASAYGMQLQNFCDQLSRLVATSERPEPPD